MVISCLALAACGSDPVDTAKIEKDVRSTLSEGSVEVASVDCPKEPVAEAGTTFTCSYDLADGSTGEVTVRVRDEDGAGRWDVTRPASGQVEADIRAAYEKDDPDSVVSNVDCEDPVAGAETGCRIEFDNRQPSEVTVTTDDDGGFSWETR